MLDPIPPSAPPSAPPLTAVRTGRYAIDAAFSWQKSAQYSALLFVLFSAITLVYPDRMREPDDWSYRAAIDALISGHLTLDGPQFTELEVALNKQNGAAMQWVQLPSGRYLSEKNPGYPILAAPFFALGMGRLAPLFYALIGCAGIWFFAGRWISRRGAVVAVGLFLFSPPALVMANRACMPTMTETSLIAGGLGFALWAFAAREATNQQRMWIGALGFFLFGLAVTVRFTSAVVPALVFLFALAFRKSSLIRLRFLLAWALAGSIPLAALALYNWVVFGKVLDYAYRYSDRLIEFNLEALRDNLLFIPGHRELWALPALVACGFSILWWYRLHRRGRHGDGSLVALLTLSIVVIWLEFAAFGWTAMARLANYIVTIRPLLPAAGAVAILAAWFLDRMHKIIIAVLLICALSFAAVQFHLTMQTGPHFGPTKPGVGHPVRSGACPPGMVCPSPGQQLR